MTVIERDGAHIVVQGDKEDRSPWPQRGSSSQRRPCPRGGTGRESGQYAKGLGRGIIRGSFRNRLTARGLQSSRPLVFIHPSNSDHRGTA